MSPALFVSILLAAPPTVETGLWGLELGASPEAVRTAFAPTGEPRTLRWTQEKRDGILRVAVRCEAQSLCFAVPAEADFDFVDNRLVAATLRADAERAPAAQPARDVLLGVSATSGLTVADASSRSVGRFTRYFVRPRHTVAWVQDGPDVEIKLYLDDVTPLGRAEAVAAGAKADLAAFPGAVAYASAHRAIAQKDFGGAIEALDALLTTAGASVFLRRQATLVLAMALAARAQRWSRSPTTAPGNWAQQAADDLKRAAALAPSLATEFEALSRRIAAGPKP